MHRNKSLRLQRVLYPSSWSKYASFGISWFVLVRGYITRYHPCGVSIGKRLHRSASKLMQFYGSESLNSHSLLSLSINVILEVKKFYGLSNSIVGCDCSE